MHERDPSFKIVFPDSLPQLLDGFVQRTPHLYPFSLLQLSLQRRIQRVRKHRPVPVRDRPHCRDDAPEAGREHGRREVDGFLGQLLVALCRLARGQDSQLRTRARHRDQPRQLEPAVVQAERAFRGVAGIVLDAVAREVDPLVMAHGGDDGSDRRLAVAKVRDAARKVRADGGCFVDCAGERRLPGCVWLGDDEDMRMGRGVAATRCRCTRMRLDESCERRRVRRNDKIPRLERARRV
jgi:hypothetical protein